MKPKKPRSSYILYLSDQRSNLKLRYPTYKASEIVKKAAENWNKLEDKSQYEQMALDDKERYKTEFEVYRDSKDFDISSLSLKELKQMCKEKKLKVSGKKAALVLRLKQNKKSVSKSVSKSVKKSVGKSVSKSVGKSVGSDTPTTVKEQIDRILEN